MSAWLMAVVELSSGVSFGLLSGLVRKALLGDAPLGERGASGERSGERGASSGRISPLGERGASGGRSSPLGERGASGERELPRSAILNNLLISDWQSD